MISLTSKSRSIAANDQRVPKLAALVHLIHRRYGSVNGVCDLLKCAIAARQKSLGANFNLTSDVA